MINVGITADFTDMDRVMGRLMSAMDESRINRVASKIAEAQIKKGYKDRWLGLTSSTTRWQSRKKFMSKGIGVGFLTGTTYNAITASYDEHMGRVFLAGRWPQGSGRLASPWGHFIEWDSSGLRVKSNPYGDAREYPSEDLATKKYGTWRKEGPISWLYLDENNIQVINDAISTSLDVAVGGVKSGGRAVKDVYIEQIINEAENQQRISHTQTQRKDSGEGFSTGGSIKPTIGETIDSTFTPSGESSADYDRGILSDGGKDTYRAEIGRKYAADILAVIETEAQTFGNKYGKEKLSELERLMAEQFADAGIKRK